MERRSPDIVLEGKMNYEMDKTLIYRWKEMMYTPQTIPNDLLDRIKRELEPGESIQWAEQPIPRYFTPTSIGSFLFGIPWTAFAVFWVCGACGFKLPDVSKGLAALCFPLFGLPFILVGLAMLSAPFWSRRKALKTIYVITDQRAITFSAGWTTTIRSFPPRELQNVYRKEKRNGTGDVILGQRLISSSEGRQSTVEVGFLAIRDPKTVERLLKDLAEQEKKDR